MTITADRAKTLLDNSTRSVWPVPRVYAVDDGGFKTGNVFITVPKPDGDLLAAAPDLARTVVAQAEKIEALRCSYQQYERFLERFYKDFAKALGRGDLLGAAEDGSEDDGQTIYELSLDAVYKAREAGLVYKAREADQ